MPLITTIAAMLLQERLTHSRCCLSGERITLTALHARAAAHPVMDGAKVSSATRKMYKVYSHVGRAPKRLANEAND